MNNNIIMQTMQVTRMIKKRKYLIKRINRNSNNNFNIMKIIKSIPIQLPINKTAIKINLNRDN